MFIPKHVCALAAAFLLAVVILSVPTAFAHAASLPEAPGLSTAQESTLYAQAPVVRDHREPRPTPVVRDHRGESGTTTGQGSTGSSVEARQKSAEQKNCENNGGVWAPPQGCAMYSCGWAGHVYTHGENFTLNDGTVKVCNGFTGTWDTIPPRAPSPGGNGTPTTGTNAPAGPLAPQSPTTQGNAGTASTNVPAPATSPTPSAPIVRDHRR
jgi:hypothetical protein